VDGAARVLPTASGTVADHVLHIKDLSALISVPLVRIERAHECHVGAGGRDGCVTPLRALPMPPLSRACLHAVALVASASAVCALRNKSSARRDSKPLVGALRGGRQAIAAEQGVDRGC
jgi:hypothetical protein